MREVNERGGVESGDAAEKGMGYSGPQFVRFCFNYEKRGTDSLRHLTCSRDLLISYSLNIF